MRRIMLVFAFLVIIALSICATWFAMTPNWVFGLATDKDSYGLGENVQITVTLENHGFISHSITSSTANSVVIAVYALGSDPTLRTQVWYSPYVFNRTTFVVLPGQALVRTFVWNQTNFVNPWLWNTTYKAGTYLIEAFIPENNYLDQSTHRSFLSTLTYINITAVTT